MLSIPNPPTDNLYKFVALSGLILILLSPIYWAKYFLSQEANFHESLQLMGESMPPSKYYLAKANIDRGEPASPEERALVDRFDALKAASDRAFSGFLVPERFRLSVTCISVIGEVVGWILCVIGFRLWYLRVQKPLDARLLKASLRVKDAEDPNEV